jgi:glutamine amidotransferase
VGPSALENTHPFERGRWLFAHNGTITDVGWLREQVSERRAMEIDGATDSELFFAYLLTRLDRAGIPDEPACAATDRIVAEAVADALARPAFGAVNFLLSDGEAVYVHRFGRTLFALERNPGDSVQIERASRETGALLETRWTVRRRAVLVASEQLSDEPWRAVDERTLARIDRTPAPCWRPLVVPA